MKGDGWWWLLGSMLCGLALGLGLHAAFGQGHSHPAKDSALHEVFYNTWMRPDKPEVSCCSNVDCYPTEARFRNGHWEAKRREDGQWLVIPPSKIERNRDMPDAQAHLCAPGPWGESHYENGVICFGAGSGT